MGREMGHYGLRHALARTAGQRKMAERERDNLLMKAALARRVVEELDAKVHQANAQIAAFDQRCADLEQALLIVFGDSAESVAPRQTFTKDHITAWGGLTRTVLAVLRHFHPEPVGADLIAELVAKRLNFTFECQADYARFRRKIGRTLKNMCGQGHLDRLHAQQGAPEGVWRLKATYE